MKKPILFIFLLFTVLVSRAQSDKLELGIQGAVNSSFIYESAPIINVGPVTNFLFGAVGQYNISEVFAIRSELNFDRKGFAQVFYSVINPASPNPEVSTTNPTNLDYITLPIMAKVSLGKKVKFFMNAGPYFGYQIGARSKITLADSSGNMHTSTFNMLSNYKHFDLGAGGGFGVEVPIMNKLILGFEGRLSYGLLDIGSPFSTNPPTKNETADIILSVRYRL